MAARVFSLSGTSSKVVATCRYLLIELAPLIIRLLARGLSKR